MSCRKHNNERNGNIMRSLLLLSFVSVILLCPSFCLADWFDRFSKSSVDGSGDVERSFRAGSFWSSRRSTKSSVSYDNYRPSKSFWNKGGSSSTDVYKSSSSNSFSFYSASPPFSLQSTYDRALTNSVARTEVAACSSPASVERQEHMKSFIKSNFELLKGLLAQYGKDYENKDVKALSYTKKHFNELLSHIEIRLLIYERDQIAACWKNPHTGWLAGRCLWQSSLANEFPCTQESRMPDELLSPSALQTDCKRASAKFRKRIAAPISKEPEALTAFEQINENVEAALGQLSLLVKDYTSKYESVRRAGLKDMEKRYFALKGEIAEKIRLYGSGTIASSDSVAIRCNEREEGLSSLPSMDILNVVSSN